VCHQKYSSGCCSFDLSGVRALLANGREVDRPQKICEGGQFIATGTNLAEAKEHSVRKASFTKTLADS
jgi:hypothetical protein